MADVTLRQEAQRVVHHCVLHPVCAVIPSLVVVNQFRGWMGSRFPAYDEKDENQVGQDPDDPVTKGWTVAWFLHHAVAHPLLVLCPGIGERLHAWTGERL